VSKSLFYSNKNTPVSTTMPIRLYKNILNKGEWFIMKKMDEKELTNVDGGTWAAGFMAGSRFYYVGGNGKGITWGRT